LAGNPNVGKSVIFAGLTGQYVDVSNYPGTTVETYVGRFNEATVIDTPGVYGISSFNDEERVARDVILQADAVINVVNAARLRQDLFLTLQLIDAGLPLIVVLNMMDEARANGVEIDRRRLEELLGVPVYTAVAASGEGMDGIKQAIKEERFRRGKADEALDFNGFAPEIPRGDRLLILEGDREVAAKYGLTPGAGMEQIYERRRERADGIADAVMRSTNKGVRWSVRLGRWAIRPLTGLPILALVLLGIFYILRVGVATHVVEFTEGHLMEGIYQPFIKSLVEKVLPLKSAAGKLLVGEFGMLTMGITYLFGLLLPLVVAFYLLLGLLEDSGYLPRIAVLADRLLTAVGLNGRAVIPIILGFGCVTMATVTTRLLGSNRERFIAVFLLGLAIPCSAQLGIITGMIAPLGLYYILVYGGVVLGIFGLAGLVLNRVLPGRSTDLLIELPPLRLPRLGNILLKTWHKTKNFLKETIPLFLLGSLILGVVDLVGGLGQLNTWASPLIHGWLGLPKEAATAFVMGILRRDFGAAGLTDLALTAHQTLVALVTMTLFVPCIAAVLVILKERGWKEGWAIWFGSLVTAFTVGGLVHRLF